MRRILIAIITLALMAGCETSAQTKGSVTDDGLGNKTWDITGEGKTDLPVEHLIPEKKGEST